MNVTLVNPLGLFGEAQLPETLWGGTRLVSQGKTVELCLHWPVKNDLAPSPCMVGSHKPNMSGRQEKKTVLCVRLIPNVPLVWWFRLVALGLRLSGVGVLVEDFQLPLQLIIHILHVKWCTCHQLLHANAKANRAFNQLARRWRHFHS